MTSSAAAQVFRAAFDGDPAGFARGPGRVNLIGEHTDYNLGFVLPFAIDRRVEIAFAPRSDRRVRLVSALEAGLVETDLDHLTGFDSWAAYPLGVTWALSQFGVELENRCGFDLAVVSDLPVGAGLSSSAALESATVMALSRMWRLDLDRLTMAQIGQRAENLAVGAPTGVMDQVASLLGRDDAAVFLDCRSLEVEAVPLGLESAGLRILVIDTRVKHAHATGGYGQRRAECEQAAMELGVASLREIDVADLPAARRRLEATIFRRLRHVVTENQRVLQAVAGLRSSGPASIGSLLNASHASMRDDFEISTPELDLAVLVANESGALGARMTGGGFGGSAIALVPQEASSTIGAAVAAAFASAGFGAPNRFEVQPVAGASILD